MKPDAVLISLSILALIGVLGLVVITTAYIIDWYRNRKKDD